MQLIYRLLSYYDLQYLAKYERTPINLKIRLAGCVVTLLFFVVLVFASFYDTSLFLLEIPLLTLIGFCFNIVGLAIDGGGINKFHWKDMVCDWIYFRDKIIGLE